MKPLSAVLMISVLAIAIGFFVVSSMDVDSTESLEQSDEQGQLILDDADGVIDDVNDTPAVTIDDPYTDIAHATVTTGVSRSIPFGNGKGITTVTDAVLGMWKDGGVIYIARFIESGYELIEVASSQVAQSLEPASLSGTGDTALAVWFAPGGMQAAFSQDSGATWGKADVLAERPSGPAVPTSCLWEENGEIQALVAWVDAPVAGEDGGPLYVRTWTDGAWGEAQQIGDLDTTSSPSLACDDQAQHIVFRNGETNSLVVWHAQRENGEWSEPERAFSGADPHMAMCADGSLWVGYHDVGSYLAWSHDGGDSWETKQLDQTGKFGSIDCDGETVAVSWGHYTSLGAAHGKVPDSRSVYASVSTDGGETWVDWQPAGDEVNQNVSTVTVGEHGVYILWELPGGVRVARWE